MFYENIQIPVDQCLHYRIYFLLIPVLTYVRFTITGICREYELMQTEQSELEYYGDISDYPESEDEEGGECEEPHSKEVKPATTTAYDSCIDLDSLRQLLDIGGAKERTRNSGTVGGGLVKSNGDVGTAASSAAGKKDLMDISETAESLLPKSVITSGSSSSGISSGLRLLLHGTLLEFQLVALDWLAALHDKRLPAVLADEHGLGRRVVVVAFIAHLVFQLCRPGPNTTPHLIICPLSASCRWESVLRSWVPALRVVVYGGSASDRRHIRRCLASVAAEEDSTHLVLVSYAAFFSDASWFLSRRWGYTVLAELQNVVAAGTPAQVAALCKLRADNRLLMMSGPHKENPIDLWTVLRLLFPVTHELHSGKNLAGFMCNL